MYSSRSIDTKSMDVDTLSGKQQTKKNENIISVELALIFSSYSVVLVHPTNAINILAIRSLDKVSLYKSNYPPIEFSNVPSKTSIKIQSICCRSASKQLSL